MKIVLATLLLIFSQVSIAGVKFSDSFVSDDTDGNTIFQQTLGFWAPISKVADRGLSYRYSKYEEEQSHRLGVLYDRRFDNKYGINIDLGVESLHDEITGSITLSRWYDKGSFELYLQQDFIDNVLGTQNGVTYTSAYLLKERRFDKWNVTSIAGFTDYSDGPKRYEGRMVALYPLHTYDGVYIRGEIQYYQFDEFSPFYFSPDEYVRGLIGAQYFHRFTSNFYIRAKFMFGHQRVNGNGRRSHLSSTTLGYEFERVPGLEATLSAVFDTKEPEYTYRMANFSLKYRW